MTQRRISAKSIPWLVVALAMLGLSPCVTAATPEGAKPWSGEQLSGLWEQYDDDTKQLSSLIRIVRTADNHYEGFVEKIIPGPGEDPNPRCTKCDGALKDKVVLGLRVVWGLWRTDETHFEQGEILDPDDGAIYRLRIEVLDKGRKLDVRGYRGISLFGRSQIWVRAANQAADAAKPH